MSKDYINILILLMAVAFTAIIWWGIAKDVQDIRQEKATNYTYEQELKQSFRR